ncbi:hypothetical protein FWK35_00038712, partial [Aphis craccivora]
MDQGFPRADRPLNQTDRVCELHFLENDIIKHFDVTGPDG